MLVRVGDGIALNPEHVVSITQSFHGTHLIITDVLGKAHEVSRGYGESIYETESRITKLLTTKEPRDENERAG